MEKLKFNLLQYPLISSVILTLVSIGILFLLKSFETEPVPLFNIPRLIALIVMSGCFCLVLIKCGWKKQAGLSFGRLPFKTKKLLAVVPFLLIALLSSTSANWGAVEFSSHRILAWTMSNLATGFFEEVLMRGLCFYLLLSAWGSTKQGIYIAAITQALIFGLAHFANLSYMPLLDVVAQVTFATLIGIGFAGLVYLTKSLWPAIIAHTIINSAGTVNDYLVPGSTEFTSPGVAGYLVIIAIFMLLSTIPGLLYLRASAVSASA